MTWRPTWTVALIFTAGAALRVAAALFRRPWHDEYFTAWVASLPWTEIVPVLAQDSGPPLPYVLAKLVATTGLEELVAARGLAVLAGSLAILVVARAARILGGPTAGLWAAAFLAFHPLALAWSAEGRAYSYLLLSSALVWDGLGDVKLGQRGSAKVAAGLALAFWSHGLGLLLLAGTVAAAAFLPGTARWRALRGAGAATVAFLPWVPVMLQQPPASLAWMQRAWQALPGWRAALAPFEFLPPVGRFGSALDLPSAPALVAAVGAAAALTLLVAGLSAYRQRALLPLITAALPASLLVVLAHLSLPVFYPGRGEALYLGPVLGLVALGAGGRRAVTCAAALLVAAGIASSGAALALWGSTPPRSEERLTAALIAHLPSGATVLVEGYWRLGLWYHLGAARSRFDLETFPPAANSHPGWYEGGATAADAERAHQRLLSQLAHGRAVACVVPPPPLPSHLRAVALALGLTPVAAPGGAELWVGGRPGR